MTYRISDKARPNLELLLSQLLKEQLKESEEAIRDSANLELCLREDVRRRLSSFGQQPGAKV